MKPYVLFTSKTVLKIFHCQFLSGGSDLNDFFCFIRFLDINNLMKLPEA